MKSDRVDERAGDHLVEQWLNFVKLHGNLRMSPAMAVGVAERLWEISDIVALMEAADEPAKKRGSYKRREAA